MSSNSSFFNLDSFTVTRTQVPDPGADCNVPAINTGAGAGARITSPGFLQAANLSAGQDQVLVHAGDQCIKVDQKKNVWIEGDESYVNHKLDHQIMGEFTEKYHKTRKSEYVGNVQNIYYALLSNKELQGDVRIRNLTETVILTGDQTTMQVGNRTRCMNGTDVNLVTSTRATAIMGVDWKVVVGLDTKQVVGLDMNHSLLKITTALIDGKTALLTPQMGCAKTVTEIACLNTKGFLARVGAFCLKGAAACLGVMRF